MKKSVLILGFILTIISVDVSLSFYKQVAQSGGLPGEFLSNFSVSAKGLAMGGAYTALVNDPTGVYYNPGAIAGIGDHQINAMYTPVLGGGEYASIYYASSLSLKYALGLGVISLTSGDAVKRNIWGENIGKFNEKRRVLSMALGYAYRENTRIGFTVKFSNQDIDTYNGSNVSLDLGLKMNSSDNVDIGIVLQNILSTPVVLKEKKEKYLFGVKSGIAVKLLDKKLITAFDLSSFGLAKQAVLRWGLGCEYSPLKFLSIRGGINYKELTMGLGINADKFGFSYAVRYSAVGMFHTAGTTYRFGILPSARERDLKKQEKEFKKKEKTFEVWRKNKRKEIRMKLSKSDSRVEEELMLIEERSGQLKSLIQAAIDIKAGYYEKAEETLKTVLKNNPGNTDANIMLGIIQEELKRDFSFKKMIDAYNNNNFKYALKESKKADKTHPQYEQAKVIGLLSTARLLILKSEYDFAEETLNEVIKLRPGSNAAKNLLQKLGRLKAIKNE